MLSENLELQKERPVREKASQIEPQIVVCFMTTKLLNTFFLEVESSAGISGAQKRSQISKKLKARRCAQIFCFLIYQTG